MANLYREMLGFGKFKNRAALARHFGVSRAWISKVLNWANKKARMKFNRALC
jgi:hypothetical protein